MSPEFKNREQRREEKELRRWEELDYKVAALIKLLKLIDHQTIESPQENIKATLIDFYHSIQSHFSRETLHRVTNVKKLNRTLNKLYDSPSYEDSEMKRIDNQRDRLLSIPDVAFLYHLNDTITSLIHQNKFIGKLRTSPNIPQKLETIAKQYELKANNITKVDFKPFCVNVTVHTWKTPGGHLHELPINIIRQDQKSQMGRVIRHEEIHNLLVRQTHILPLQPSHLLQVRIKRYKQLINVEAPSGNIDTQKNAIQNRVGTYIDELHHEIVAEILTYGLKLSTKEKWLHRFFFVDDEPLDAQFRYYIKEYATAGVEAQKITTMLKLESQKNEDETSKSFFRNLEILSKQQFVNLAKTIINAFEYAGTLSPRADYRSPAIQYIFALSFILKPSQYDLIKRYLDYKFQKHRK